jgi:hypothetical protein
MGRKYPPVNISPCLAAIIDAWNFGMNISGLIHRDIAWWILKPLGYYLQM